MGTIDVTPAVRGRQPGQGDVNRSTVELSGKTVAVIVAEQG